MGRLLDFTEPGSSARILADSTEAHGRDLMEAMLELIGARLEDLAL